MKIMTFGLPGTMGFFGSLGYPPIFGAIVAIAETLAGIALILGVWTRAVSLLTLPILVGALLQHSGNGCVQQPGRRLGIPGSPPCWCRPASAAAPMRWISAG